MIYLISRAPRFSPNSVERDEAIFKALLMELSLQGRAVRAIDEEALPDSLVDADLVVSMGRAADTLRCLAELEARGVPVLNSPTALLRNTRSHLDALACSVDVGVRSVGNTTDVARIEQVVGYPLWLKRGDTTAQSVGDVRFVTDRAQLSEGLHFLADNGCTDFVAMEHVEGDLVKFYGVAGTPFFHCTLPTAEGGFSKFGLEAHNGRPQGHPFDAEALKATADRLALASGMPIYGGDAVVRPDGSTVLIDFNDFPSFGGCTQAAAKAIADHVAARLSEGSTFLTHS